MRDLIGYKEATIDKPNGKDVDKIFHENTAENLRWSYYDIKKKNQ